ncbi:MaoC family dehydratase N-terminal domain-containing protein [Pseudooceanicola sp. MF1-13]|uniref:FAS1-like dehydratase domain-containing protein n=1 Tax=Pseudooceanicola sp. MF1-13 TaxID=3379095 RepID=UPI003891E8AC
MDKLNAQAWTGRETCTQGCITDYQARLIHATIGEGAAPGQLDPLPLLWHWCAFPPTAPMENLGRDGHERGSSLLPPVRLDRRMWAGGSLSFHQSLRVGEPIERMSRVKSVVEKEGKTGPMVLVSVEHSIYGARGLAIQEQQDIVYLDIPDTFAPPAKRDIPAVSEQVPTPETLLFRYSALTFNAHRIHYDLPYTQQVEKYPALVVHGPLQASLLMRAAVREKGRNPIYFSFRSVHPMFAGGTCDIATEATDEGLRLWTGQDGHQCMTATATWEETQ